jgi:hypothetical protein
MRFAPGMTLGDHAPLFLRCERRNPIVPAIPAF